MRKLIALLLAFGLIVGVGSSALANCGADHTNTATPSSERPQPQT